MRDVPCALCQKPLGDSIRSGYTPYATHADKRICVANMRADERERIASLLEDYGYGDAAMIVRNEPR